MKWLHVYQDLCLQNKERCSCDWMDTNVKNSKIYVSKIRSDVGVVAIGWMQHVNAKIDKNRNVKLQTTNPSLAWFQPTKRYKKRTEVILASQKLLADRGSLFSESHRTRTS